jgi:uncharacterized protein YndB with AHSA1/START domain
VVERVVSVERVITAPPERIFDLLADPSQHARFDGSGTVQRYRGEAQRLQLGATFSMSMRVGVPYVIRNTVVEFEEGRLIAWRHFGRHIWRYRLEPVPEAEGGGTRVTESFDWSGALWPQGIELLGYPKRHPAAMEATLEGLAAASEDELPAGPPG